MTSYSLYQVQSTNSLGKLTVDTVENAKINPLQNGLVNLVNCKLNNTDYVIGFNPTTKKAVVYITSVDGTFFKESFIKNFSFGTSIIDVFYMGNRPMLLTYNPEDKHADIIHISDDFEFTSAYQVKIGKGLSTVKTFSYRFGQFFIAYDVKNGAVAKYQISIPPNGIAYAEKTWSATWAKGWTRFSFFQMGGENFFIKTNEVYGKVNIDHFMDDPTESSHPVLNIDVPDQMLNLNFVSAFTNVEGFPFFATYRTNGETTYNSIYGNCLGWSIECTMPSIADASCLFSFNVGTNNYTLVYNNLLETTSKTKTKLRETYV